MRRLVMNGAVGGRGDATRIQTSINTLGRWALRDQISKRCVLSRSILREVLLLT